MRRKKKQQEEEEMMIPDRYDDNVYDDLDDASYRPEVPCGRYDWIDAYIEDKDS